MTKTISALILLSAVMPLRQRGAVVKLEAGGKKAPSEFRIFAFGEMATSKGTFLFDEEGARSVMAAWAEHGNELGIDYEHMALQDPPMPSPAAAWFRPELRSDGLWAADVKWTPKAAAHLEAGEYRYFSPAFESEPKTGRVMRLVNLALTNLPATRAMTPLVAAADRRSAVALSAMSFDAIRCELEALLGKVFADPERRPWLNELYDDHLIVAVDGHLYSIPYAVSGASVALAGPAVEVQRTYTPVAPSGEGDPQMKTLLTALALTATATEAEGVAAVTALRADLDGAARKAADSERELLALTGAKTTGEAQGVLLSWKASAAQVVALSSSLKAAEDKLAAQAAEVRTAQVLSQVEAAIKDGKIAPAQKDYFLSMGKKDVDMLTGYLSTAVPMVTTAPIAKPAGEDKHAITLSEAEKKVAAKMGISEADFAATKKAHEAKAK